VDDHVDTCEGMRLLLERRGYAVVIAHGVAEGLKAARENEIDLVISDLGLPDGSGFKLMREIRLFRDVVGVALSGFGMENDIRKSHEAGFSEHLIKPVSIERLDAILKGLFDEAESIPYER
jgi:DNA-binding response OmpR family regulator